MDAIGQDKPVAHCSMTVFRPFGVRYGSEKYANLPYMQCEYAHCMGNSLGNFSDYWENFKKYDRMAGGFIWDFADQSIKVVNNGVTEYRFGGDFGDKPNAGVFAFNGILRADRTPNPALYEVRKQYQMVDFSLTDGNLTLLNNFMFTNLGGYALRLNYRRDGERVSESETVLTSVAPGETYSVKISEPDGYGEITLLAELVSPYERKVVAYEQFMLRKTKFALRELLAGVSCEEDNWQIKVNTSDTQIIVDKVTGGITSICKNGAEKLRNPIMPNFVRPTIDNDRFPQVNLGIVKKIMGVYKFHKAMKKLSPKSVKLTENGGIAKVHIDWKFLYARLSTEYTFGKDAVDFSMSVKPRCELIRYGFTFGTREAVKEMNFYAKGPFENYCDRKTAAVLGKYSGKAEDFSHEYLSPQENGNHTEARYLDLGSADNGFVITAKDMPFEFGVLPYSLDKLEAAAHLHELKKDDHYTVTVDGRQRGVGGDIPAVACLKPQYKIHRGESYGFTFRMTVK
jgi:beta-galactosidase